MKQVLQIGRHLLQIEEDVVHWEAHGACEVDDLRQIIAIGEQLAARYGRYYSVIDAHDGITITPEARRYNAEWERAHGGPKALTIIYGANPVLRMLVSLVSRASQLVRGRAPDVIFVKGAAEVAALIASDRQRRRSA